MSTEPTADYRDRMRACADAIGLNPPAIVLPSDHFVQLADLKFHYLDWGNPQLPHLVLMHGGGLTAHTWDMAALLLREKYHIVALDMRGHGDTEWTDEARIDEDLGDLITNDVERFLDHLALPKFSLAVMSIAGAAGMRYAAKHPERLSSLILVDVAPEGLPEGGQATRAFHRETDILQRFEDFLERAAKFNPARKPEHIEYSLTHSLRHTDEGWTWKQDPRPRDRGQLVPDEIRRERGAKRSAELWETVKKIPVPTLVLRGEKSRGLGLEVAERTAREMPNARLVTVPGASGFIPGDAPKDCAREVDAFLSSVPLG